MGKRGTWCALALLAMVAAGTSACGNRLTSAEIRAQNTVKVSGEAAGQQSTGAAGEATGVGPGDATATTVAGATGASGTPTTAAASGAGGAAGGGQQAASSGSKAPIVIGYIAWLSGLGGDTISPTRDVWQAWAKSVNAKGGINGHPVQLLIGDHGGNEARALSIARDFVENKHAIVLSSNQNGPGLGDYAKSKGIPMIGSILTGGNWNANPYLFPPFGAEYDTSWGAVALLKRAGVTKIAAAYCAESPDCQSGSNRFAQAVKDGGAQLVASQRYSETQPDFTTECLQMKSSGAQAVYATGSTAAMIRMAKSCSRQNFKPIWTAPTMEDSIASIPEFENALAVNQSFPWFLRSGNPGVQEYAAALGKYAPSRLTKGNTFMSGAWASAKLLEKAAANLPATPTSQDLLNALWAMKGESLGGLIPPRTFVKGQPTPETFCIYEGRVKGGKWTAPDGMKPLCK